MTVCEVCNGNNSIKGLIEALNYDLFECGACGAIYRRTINYDSSQGLARMS